MKINIDKIKKFKNGSGSQGHPSLFFILPQILMRGGGRLSPLDVPAGLYKEINLYNRSAR